MHFEMNDKRYKHICKLLRVTIELCVCNMMDVRVICHQHLVIP